MRLLKKQRNVNIKEFIVEIYTGGGEKFIKSIFINQ